MSQPFLIDRIIKAINFDSTTTMSARDSVLVGFHLLNKDVDGPARETCWKYGEFIGMLGYLQGTSHPVIAMGTDQCERFNNDPKLSHEKSSKEDCKVFKDRRIIFKPDLAISMYERVHMYTWMIRACWAHTCTV